MSDQLNKLAEALWLKLGNRIAGLLVVPLIMWGLHSLAQMHDDTIKMTQEIVNHEERIGRLESWRDSHSASVSFVEGAVK